MKTSPASGKILLARVLFATDFSDASMHALPFALAMATRYRAKLYPAHVIPIEPYLIGDQKAQDRLRQAWKEADLNLAGLADSLSSRGISSEVLVDNGDIWSVLSGFINGHSVDLLVIGTTGRTGLRKVLLGSVAEEAIRQSPCPVLAVGPKAPSDETIKFEKILYATDFSTDSLLAAPYALSFAAKFRARLTLLHVIEGLPESPYLDAQMARVHLNELVTHQVESTSPPEARVEMGSPADMILKIAAETASNLIVIGARGAGALPRLATHFGSIAHKVVSRATCPVLTAGGPREGGNKSHPA